MTYETHLPASWLAHALALLLSSTIIIFSLHWCHRACIIGILPFICCPTPFCICLTHNFYAKHTVSILLDYKTSSIEVNSL